MTDEPTITVDVDTWQFPEQGERVVIVRSGSLTNPSETDETDPTVFRKGVSDDA